MPLPTAPVVTVILACYNAQDSVVAAVQSALSQTEAGVEVLLVDDCSTDSTWKVLQGLQDPRVKIFRLEVNLGPGPARNLALEQARGGWITFMDADDLFHPQRLERLLEVARREGPEAIVLDRSKTWRDRPPQASVLVDPPEVLERISLERWLREDRGGKVLFARSLLQSSEARQPSVRAGEDTAFILRLGWKTRSELVLTTDRTYLYRVGQASLTSSPEQPKRVLEMIALLRDDLASRPDLLEALQGLERKYEQRLFMKQLRTWVRERRLRRAARELVIRPRMLVRLPLVALKAARLRLRRR